MACKTLYCRVTASLVLAGASLMLIGCGSGTSASGKVTLDGRPLPQGLVHFERVGTGPSATAYIQQGTYQTTKEGGSLAAGPYVVRIEAFLATGETKEVDGATEEVRRQVVPPKYNAESELKVEVASGANTFDFNLTDAIEPTAKPIGDQ